MSILVRRSNLLLPATNADHVREAWRHNADAITLDLEEGVDAAHKGEGRALVRDAIPIAAQAGADVFVRVNKGSLRADLEASVWPRIRGIMLPQVDSAAEVMQAAEIVASLERERAIPIGALSFIVLLESARAVWDIRSIITASPRVTQVGLDEHDLAASLGFERVPELDPFVYARGRLAFEATAARVHPVGVAPPDAGTHAVTQSEIHLWATKARNLGMKGIVCRDPGWVAPVNAAFTPTAELVAWNKRVREAFAAGVAAGTAAVPLEGKMIDVPVDEWAIVVIATAEACAARDAEKQAALNRLEGAGAGG